MSYRISDMHIEQPIYEFRVKESMNTCDHWQSQPPASHTAHRPSVDTNNKMIMGKERKGTWQLVGVGEVTHRVVGGRVGKNLYSLSHPNVFKIINELLNKYYMSSSNSLVKERHLSVYGHCTVIYGRQMFHTEKLPQFSVSRCLCPFTRLDLHIVTALKSTMWTITVMEN
jgi:hypothetical protein